MSDIPVISPKPIDQEPEQHIVSVVITTLAVIILFLIAVILFIVARNRRTRTAAVLDALQHNHLHSDGLGIDKRLNSNFKVSMDDNESIDKSSLYHEPFNVNMYTSAASGCTLNDLQRHHVTPDYTGETFLAHLILCKFKKLQSFDLGKRLQLLYMLFPLSFIGLKQSVSLYSFCTF